MKTLVLSLTMAVLFVLPVSAQNSDDFFQVDDVFTNRDPLMVGLDINFNTEIFGAPLGSGLFITAMAAAGYAVIRRKRYLHKGITMLLAFVMIFGLTKCKKNVETINDVAPNKVHITLNVGNGSKVGVDTSSGVISFETGDMFYVGNGDVFIGTLSYNGSAFEGDLSISDGEFMYFYLLGGKGFSPEIGTNTYTVDISNQSEQLPVITSGNVQYVDGTTSYTVTMRNKCALVKFNIEKESGYEWPINCLTGLNNKVTVDFSTNEITFGVVDGSNGLIMLPSGSGVKWAILLPTTEPIAEGASGTAFAGRFKGVRPALPTITDNGLLTGEGDEGYTVTIKTPFVPTGVIGNEGDFNNDKYLFSVSASKKVMFSRGNLQYIGSTGKWQFASHQYERLSGQGNTSTTTSRDLLGWATSGYNLRGTEVNYYYHPYDTDKSNDTYYGISSATGNLTGANEKGDWGYNIITDNNAYKQWRTLSFSEWDYLINRTDKKGNATVAGIHGIILLPDSFVDPQKNTAEGSGGLFRPIVHKDYGYSANVYSADDWNNYMETAGALFLPVSGYRWGTSIENTDVGYYWSNEASSAGNARFLQAQSNTILVTGSRRCLGASVRLVCE